MISRVNVLIIYGMISMAVASQHQDKHHHEGTSYALSNLHSDGHHEGHEHVVDYHAHPKYKFDYHVNDHHTGDHKAQAETRDGDVVKGFYTLHEPDGTILEVHYEADKKTGFNAKVVRKGKSHHPEVQKHHEHKKHEHHEHEHNF